MAKQITKKSDIPKYIQKRIKNFKELTTNQALYEYELYKLERRAGGEFKFFIRGFYQRPDRVYKKDIQEVHNVRGKTLKKQREDYNFKRSHPNLFISDYDETPKQPRVELSEYDELSDYEKEKITNDLQDEFALPTPEPEPVEQYESDEEYFEEPEEYVPYYEEDAGSPDDYWVDPNTGEAIHYSELRYAEQERAAIEFLENLKNELRQQGDAVAIAHSYYANGKTRSPSQRRFYNDNIDKAVNTVIEKIDAILGNKDKLANFVNNHSQAYNNWEALVIAAMEYVADSYKTKGGDAAQAEQAARLNALLSAEPVSLDEAMNFVDEAYDVDE